MFSHFCLSPAYLNFRATPLGEAPNLSSSMSMLTPMPKRYISRLSIFKNSILSLTGRLTCLASTFPEESKTLTALFILSFLAMAPAVSPPYPCITQYRSTKSIKLLTPSLDM